MTGNGEHAGVDAGDVRAVAAHLIDLVRRADPSAEAEAVVDRGAHALTRFANSSIHQNVAASVTKARLRVHAAGHTASGSTSVIDPDGLRALVEQTLAAARLSPADRHWPGLTPPTPVPAADAVDEATAHAEPAARAERVHAFVEAAGGLVTAGYCATTFRSTAFANSAGQSAWAQAASAAMDGIARVDGRDGVARLAATRLGDLDGARLGARAAAKARAGRAPIELPPGRYEVVLEPTAVADLLELFGLYGFNGKAVTERRSFVTMGEIQFDPSISLVDEPFATSGLPFDVEGTPRHRLVLVDAGVSAAVAYDRRSAAVAGTSSTGHAIAGGAAWGAIPTNLHLLPPAGAPELVDEVGGPAADASVADLVAQVERGLLVTDHWYTRVLDPRTLVTTGLTRNGVWLIENGLITRPVQDLRFTQSYPDALGPGAVLAVGRHAVALPTGWEGRSDRAPALRLASWNYTGNASG